MRSSSKQTATAIKVSIRREDTEVWEVDIPANARLRVDKGDEVHAGQQLTEGAKNPERDSAHSGA